MLGLRRVLHLDGVLDLRRLLRLRSGRLLRLLCRRLLHRLQQRLPGRDGR
ncbi:hypothetical protein JOE68_004338 [Saccharothrix algeriensis]|uniref:Uncharacterized protein n=1 Tax=Saccharothrix algeriensis TaxID=173560 RepID=A0ABS2SDV0_9PSEU|nr:hypothetical protein [Saccharothrix algeriensis]